MYETVEDPYCYPGTDTLINKLDIREPELLAAFEAEMTAARADEPLPLGRLSVTHYRKIHHHLFQDVYSWAGRYRSTRISKGGSMFCYPENIASEMPKRFAQLKQQRFLRNLLRRVSLLKQPISWRSSMPSIRLGMAMVGRSWPS